MIKKWMDMWKSREARPSLNELASFYGLERRKTVRVLYPDVNQGLVLPTIHFEDFRVQVRDISEGGFCLCSNALTEQLNIGQDYEFDLCWDRGQIKMRVMARHIAVSHEKIHFQFEQISPACLERLKASIDIAKRGLAVKSSFFGVNNGIQSEMKEIWVNGHLDKVVVYQSNQPWIEVNFLGESFTFTSGSQPQSLKIESYKESVVSPDSSKQKQRGLESGIGCEKLAQQTTAELLVFLSNISSPSEDIKALMELLTKSVCKRESA